MDGQYASVQDFHQTLDQTLIPLSKLHIGLHKIEFKDDVEIPGGGLGPVRMGVLQRQPPFPPARVAVKLVGLYREDKHPHPRLTLSIGKEIQVWSKMDSPYIQKLIAIHISQTMESIWVITPFENHGNIRQYLQHMQPDMDKRLGLVEDLVNAVSYLHGFDPPLCHGDIKPTNVLITSEHRAILCDFGLARAEHESTTFVSNKNFKSSTRYLSPEVLVAGVPRDSKSDMWAVACVILEIVTDIIPYVESDNNPSIIRNIKSGRLPALVKTLNMPVFLVTLVNNCWKANPIHRPTIEQFRVALANARQPLDLESLDTPIQIQPPPVPAPTPIAPILPGSAGTTLFVPSPAGSRGPSRGTTPERKSLLERRPSPIRQPLSRSGSQRGHERERGRPPFIPPNMTKRMRISLKVTFEDHAIECLRFSLDGRYLAICGGMQLHICSTATGARIRTLEDSSIKEEEKTLSFYRSLCFSRDDQLLATGSEDCVVRVWDVATGALTQCLEGHDSDVVALHFSPDNKLLASGSTDGTVKIWDLASSTAVRTLFGDEPEYSHPPVSGVAFSPNCRYVAVSSMDTVVRIWDIQKDYVLERLEGHWGYVYSVAWMPDGKALVTGGLDRTVKYWDVIPNGERPSANCRLTFAAHQDYVWSVAVSQDEEGWVASGARHGGLMLWNVRSGHSHALVDAHRDCVTSIDLVTLPGEAGGLLASGSWDGTVRIWSYAFTY